MNSAGLLHKRHLDHRFIIVYFLDATVDYLHFDVGWGQGGDNGQAETYDAVLAA